MKAILINGKYAGQVREVEGQEEIKISRWKCDAFPSAGYQVNYIYVYKFTVNVGKPIAYYCEYIPVGVHEYIRSNQMLDQSRLAAQRNVVTNQFGSLGSQIGSAFGRC